MGQLIFKRSKMILEQGGSMWDGSYTVSKQDGTIIGIIYHAASDSKWHACVWMGNAYLSKTTGNVVSRSETLGAAKKLVQASSSQNSTFYMGVA